MSTVAERYRRFAEVEAAGRSAVYEQLALAIAQDDRVLALIAGLPLLKQQANLVLAAARFAGVPLDAARFTGELVARWPQVREVVLASCWSAMPPARSLRASRTWCGVPAST